VFGIGNAAERLSATSSKPNAQERGPLTFTWYSLAAAEPSYRPLPVELTEGPDLAQPLRDVWTALEENAERIDRLYRQQAGLQCKVIVQDSRPVLTVTVPLAEAGDKVVVMLGSEPPQYLVHRGADLFAVDPGTKNIDRGVYLLLAELAARA
jgi:hypothetical protein